MVTKDAPWASAAESVSQALGGKHSKQTRSQGLRAAAEYMLDGQIPFRVRPMLATLVSKPFDRPNWVYEEKYDGYRLLAYKQSDAIQLVSRNGRDRTQAFASIAKAIRSLPERTLLLDGEAVAFDRHKVSRFQLLQKGRSAQYAIFDCLYKDGVDLRPKPLSQRRRVLECVVASDRVVFVSRRLADNGLEAFRIAKQRDFEGIVAKDNAAPYVEARSTKWLKVKVHQEEELVIVGFTRPEGTRLHFGALLLGAYDAHKHLRYVGKVGTGFKRSTLTALARMLRPMIRKNSSLINEPRERGLTFVEPKLVAQIAFQEWTADGKLRQPVYLGLRDDKKPEEVILPEKYQH